MSEHLLLIAVAQEVGDDASHTLLEAHALDLVILDVAAQREAQHELVEVDGPQLILRRLCRDEGALDVVL